MEIVVTSLTIIRALVCLIQIGIQIQTPIRLLQSESQFDCFSLSHSSIASVCCAAVRFVIVALLFY